MNSVMPFSGVTPLRLVGTSTSFPFCSIVSEGKLIYSSGSHILLENTKTHEQKIVYTHTLQGEIQLILHHTSLYNEHLLALALREESSFLQTIVIVPLSTTLFSLEEGENRCKVHYLKHLEDYEQIEGLEFFEEGSLYGVVSKTQQITNFSLLKTSTGDLLFRESYLHTHLLLSSTSLGKQNYISQLLLDKRDGTRLCLMASDELSRRLYFGLALEKDEFILQYSFEASHDESILLVSLTSRGFIAIFKVNELEAVLQARINAKMEGTSDQLLITSSDKLIPNFMQTSGNRVIVTYRESKLITLFQFSIFDPNQYTVVPLREALEQFSYITATHSIKLSKDGCSLAALFQVSPQDYHHQLSKTTPFTTKALPQSPQSRGSLIHTAISEASSSKQIPMDKQHFVVLQIDLLSNIIDHNHKKLSVGTTLSVCAGQAPVQKVQYCIQSNTMFVLLRNKTLKYYDLTPSNRRGKPEYKPDSLQLWTCALSDQPISLAVHPFNFSLLLLYNDIIKVHNYNCKCLFPALIVSSVQHTTLAAFSPLGDKIVLVTGSSLTILNAYTYRAIRQVTLPNLQLQVGLELPSSSEPKTITEVYFINNQQMMVLSGHNTISLVYSHEKAVHFGFLQHNGRNRKKITFDPVNQLASLIQSEQVLVLSKASLGTNKCDVVNKIQVAASSLLEVAQLGVFFIGGKDGCLYMLKWPHYSQQQLYLTNSHRIILFDQPIVSIYANKSFKYLYAVSEQGSLAILELTVAEGDNVCKQYKDILLKLADLPLDQNERWLISRNEEEKKERELIKLRGEEADTVNNHAHLGKEQHNIQETMIQVKRGELEKSYLSEIKEYEEKLGLQKVLQQISLLKDQFRLIKRRRERDTNQLIDLNNRELNRYFQQRRKLEMELSVEQENLIIQKQSLEQTLKNQLKYLMEDFRQQNAEFLEKEQQSHTNVRQGEQNLKFQKAEVEEANQQALQAMRSQFTAEIQKLMEVGQAILSKNRNTNVSSYCLQDKISEVGIEKEKVQIDLQKINQERDHLHQMEKELEKSLESTNFSYNKLIKQTRELEEQLLKERRMAGKLHCDLTALTEDLTVLEEREKELQNTYQKLNNQFIEQKEKYYQNNQIIKTMNQKIQHLKNLKKEKNYQSSLAKIQVEQAIRTVSRELDSNPAETLAKLKNDMKDKQESLKDSEMSVYFEEQREGLDKMFRNAHKWKSLKQTYFGGLKKNNYKFNEQNLKLTYQYNDLFKVSQEYKIQLTDLQDKIQTYKKQREQSVSLLYSRDCDSRPQIRCSMFSKVKNATKDRKELIRKKGVCVSLHQETGKFITQA